ncbi:GNAT family N-acetyltransferase [Streptomyces albogriseolus]|jgi:RimJ/RimL family protein N-acetyltransferase|uniref:GNAT family N-acetyltransferase n=2 Tax=Streptomyces albogriseolus group TaxID=2867120 RepID=A0ABP6U7K1_9ACTN|nr:MULTISPECIES: GNAT family N-acetyltransferase [Streptomyces]GHC11141.1 N-acetyltransferase [Streptomyces albogriseolus]MCX4565848.1 GNAT family N-acetyltransferase [Streptomyces viridodiastaticus]MCX4619100.1 GNAT family N-acetyltransferase [Streptomyces viridodiastaticus]NIL53741.1 GNAT family N-acetyltransferase [Streptomyces sp. 2BBP-J2]GHG09824.1 N-acetyltransferase [Streptomyces viridodiastaticus]
MTSTFPDISLSTERLVLRPLDADDVPALAAMMSDEQVGAWTGVPQPFTEDTARTWITEYAPAERAAGHGLDLAVAEFLTQRLVGLIRLTRTNWHVRSTELSYIVAPWARGEGYASEAALATAQWLFGDQKLQRVELRTAADNTAAQQVAQKIGCISEGVLRNACIARVRGEDGGWSEVRTDYIVWSLLPEDIEGADGQLAGSGGFPGYTDWN